MNSQAILDSVQTVLKVAALVMSAGADAAPYVTTALSLIQGKRTLTAEERQTLLDQENALRNELQAPLGD